MPSNMTAYIDNKQVIGMNRKGISGLSAVGILFVIVLITAVELSSASFDLTFGIVAPTESIVPIVPYLVSLFAICVIVVVSMFVLNYLALVSQRTSDFDGVGQRRPIHPTFLRSDNLSLLSGSVE